MNGKLLDLPVAQVDAGTNVRTKVDADLRRSVEEVGILQPITVTPREDDRYDVLYGHRRLAAARAAGLRTIPAIVQAEPDDLPLRQLIENQQRRAVDPLDVARTLRTYLDEHPGMRQVELAKMLSRSTHWVSTRLKATHERGVASLVVELEGRNGKASNQATISVDRNRGECELLLEDGDGFGVMVTLSPAATRLLGHRLTQAFQALEAGKVA